MCYLCALTESVRSIPQEPTLTKVAAERQENALAVLLQGPASQAPDSGARHTVHIRHRKGSTAAGEALGAERGLSCGRSVLQLRRSQTERTAHTQKDCME